MADAWTQFSDAEDEDIPLFRAALMIAHDEYPDLDAAYFEDQVETWRTALEGPVRRAGSTIAAVQALNRYLFEELGFAGNDEDFYDPRNSYLNDVIERRLGIPISLGVVHIELARRLGLGLEGIAFPGHFLVRMPVQGGVMVLDPFQGGRSLDVDELRLRAQAHVRREALADEDLIRLLDPASHRAILTRMLRNLRSVYAEREDLERALRCADRLLQVDPSLAAEYRERARLYQALGHALGAAADLRRYLAMAPGADDAPAVRQQLIDVQRAAGGQAVN